MDYTQAQDVITQAIGIMSVEDKETLIDMLQRNGVMVSHESTQQEVLDSTFRAIKDSARFRKELTDYFSEEASTDAEDMSGTFSNDSGKKQTKVGSFLSTLFSEENISKGISIGMDYLSSSLQAKAQKGVGQQAIALETAKAQSASAEQAKIEALSKLQPTSKTPKWVLPIAIVGGVLLIGTILFFKLRKK